MGTVMETGRVDEVWEAWRLQGGIDVRSQLVCHYLPLVKLVARSAGRRIPESDRPDLIGFGVIGLMDAIDKFDADVGVQFETYASRRIRGAMVDGMRTLRWFPRDAERRSSRKIHKIVPVDFQTARTPWGSPLADTLSDRSEWLPGEDVEIAAEHQEVVRALATLPARESRVIFEYYFERRCLADIGTDMGISESRTCQLHRRALQMLRSVLCERLAA
jgi:RNA polymerase sigma factor for flagellar operon FliA